MASQTKRSRFETPHPEKVLELLAKTERPIMEIFLVKRKPKWIINSKMKAKKWGMSKQHCVCCPTEHARGPKGNEILFTLAICVHGKPSLLLRIKSKISSQPNTLIMHREKVSERLTGKIKISETRPGMVWKINSVCFIFAFNQICWKCYSYNKEKESVWNNSIFYPISFYLCQLTSINLSTMSINRKKYFMKSLFTAL